MNEQVNEESTSTRLYTLSTTVDKIGLPIKIANYLRRSHIYTLNTLVRTSEDDLLLCKYIGPQVIDDIKKQLALIGLHLSMSEEELAKLRERDDKYRLEQIKMESERLAKNNEIKKARLEEIKPLLEQKRQLEEQSKKLDEQILSIINQLGIEVEVKNGGKSRK